MTEREAIFGMLEARASIYERRTEVKNYRSVFDDVLIYENVPCALTKPRKTLGNRGQGVRQGLFAELSYDAELFLDPDLAVKAGSRVDVTGCGRTTSFTSCGEPFCYPTHQEILLKREENV